MGWNRALPDFRDFSIRSPEIQEILGKLEAATEQPVSVDLREYFPEPHDQGNLNSATAHALLSLVEYFERRANGVVVELSRLFLYYVARKVARLSGDSGADLRSTLKALIRFGVPLEAYLKYDPSLFDVAPEAFLYSSCIECKPTKYLRLDCGNQSGTETLLQVKSFLAAGFPVAFGFPVPCSISMDEDIPFRPTVDSIIGGQAALAIGYDDRRPGDSRGALLLRNSWGAHWGEHGCGWLPYAYVEQQLAGDFWTMLLPRWLESGEFKTPSVLTRQTQPLEDPSNATLAR